jgi:hypothetical protein
MTAILLNWSVLEQEQLAGANAKSLKEMVGTRRLELLTSTVSKKPKTVTY